MFELVKNKKINQRLQEITNKLTLKQITSLNSYIRRLTRRYLPKPRVTRCRTILLDENMYKAVPNQSEFKFISLVPRKQFSVKLTSNWHYRTNGNLQLVLDYDKKRVEVHKTIETKITDNPHQENILGIDKGLATLISCSSQREYGAGFGSLSYKEVERLAEVSKSRNIHIQKAKILKQEIAKYQEKLAVKYNKRVAAKFTFAQSQLDKLERNNLGSKRYSLKHKSFRGFLEANINHEINVMIKRERPTMVIKEDLTFTKDKLPKTGSIFEKRMRRNLSSWTKGTLNERLEYKFSQADIRTADVNPAYTSQYCPYCKQKYLERTGPHKSIEVCKYCGKVNANTSAAINIKNRYKDSEITLYTPYKKVKEILDRRAKEHEPLLNCKLAIIK